MVTIVIIVLMVAVSAGVGVVIVKAAHILPEKEGKQAARKQKVHKEKVHQKTGRKKRKTGQTESKDEPEDADQGINSDVMPRPPMSQMKSELDSAPEKADVPELRQTDPPKEVPAGTTGKYRITSSDASAAQPVSDNRQAKTLSAATKRIQTVSMPVEKEPVSQLPHPVRSASGNRMQNRGRERNVPEMSGTYMGYSGDEVQHFRRAELLDLIEDQQEQIETLERKLEQRDAAMQRDLGKNQEVDRALQMVDQMVKSINDSRDASVYSLQNLSAVLSGMRESSQEPADQRRRRRRQEE